VAKRPPELVTWYNAVRSGGRAPLLRRLPPDVAGMRFPDHLPRRVGRKANRDGNSPLFPSRFPRRMGDETTADPVPGTTPDPAATNPPPQSNPPPTDPPPAPQPAPTPTPASAADVGAVLRTLVDGLAAIPEKVAQAVQEAAPKPPANPPAPQAAGGQATAAQAGAQGRARAAAVASPPPGKRQKFTNWWFGNAG
jgi:hypothetical protein